MRFIFAFCLGVALTPASSLLATDIVTLSGKRYLDVRDVQIRDGKLTFSTDTEIVKVPLSDIPPALQQRYKPKPTPTPPPSESPATTAPGTTSDPGKPASSAQQLVVNVANKYLAQMGADLKTARTSDAIAYSIANGFPISRIEDAHRDALTNGRAISFFILDETLLNVPCKASEPNLKGAFAHFFQTFCRNTTPVFVFPKKDLAQLPGPLSVALGKMATVPTPRVIFTNSDMTTVLYDLTLSSPGNTLAEREELMYPAAGMIKRWYIEIANSVP